MVNPQGWDQEAADIIARDSDMEEPPPFLSGHDAFVRNESAYSGWSDLELHDE